MSEDIPSIHSLSPARNELPRAPAIEPPIDHTALGDRIPFTLESQQMAAFVATMPPEQEEVFEVQMAEQLKALWLQEKRKPKQTVDNSITATTRPVEVTLVDLPLEILTHILFHLPFTSVMICQGVNRHLRVLISESIQLQYYIHLGMYGMRDNPHCDLSVSQRLNRLLVKQRRWEELDPEFYRIIDVPVVAESKRRHHSAGIFSMLHEGGIIHTIQIPSEADQKVEWKERIMPFLITSGKRILEQDLEVLLTAQLRTVYASAARPYTTHDVRVYVNQLSTGEPHPDAQRIISFETDEGFEELWAGIECVGDNLVLVLQDYMEGHEFDDQVYVYDWKTGERKMTTRARANSYRHPLFLTMDTFLLPNATTGGLEYWKLPQSPLETTSDRPFFILSLPPLFPGNVFRQIMANATRLAPGLHAVSNPFYTDPGQAIICFDLTIGPGDRTQETTDFAFFIHRSSLMKYLHAFSAFISSDEGPTPVPYNDWGPSVCRWFNEYMDGYLIGWNGGTFGQKHTPRPIGVAPLLLLNFSPTDVARAVVVERHISKAKARGEGDPRVDKNGGRRDVEKDQEQLYAGAGKEVLSQLHQASALGFSSDFVSQGQETDRESRIWTRGVIQGLDPLDDPNRCFENTVYSSLPYTIRLSQSKYDFDNLYLDGERILGTQTGESWSHVKQLHVLHYG